MKKTLSILLASVFAATLLAGCGSKSKETSASGNGVVKLGLGHETSIKSSKDLGKDKDGKDVLPVGQADTIIAAVGFDKDGKVAKISFDFAQSKINFDKDMKITSNLTTPVKTKKELGADYGMLKASAIKKEWFEQAKALEDWMVGKTVDEIKNMKTKKKDDAHPAVPDVAELTSSVSISVEEFIAAVEEASKTAVEVKGDVAKVGLGTQVSIASSKPLGKDKDGKDVLPVAQADAVMAAAAFDKDGKVLCALIDTAQTKINFSKDGKVTSDKNAEYKTKVELGAGYGLKKASKIGKEWFEQAKALQDWMVGKTADEIKNMKTAKRDDAHPAVPDVEELKSSVTVNVADYIASVAEAYANAK